MYDKNREIIEDCNRPDLGWTKNKTYWYIKIHIFIVAATTKKTFWQNFSLIYLLVFLAKWRPPA
jgi:hypothetical protein